MSTRGFIAEKYGDSWRGRYNHWDSYPSGLGKNLWGLYHGRFEKNIDQMVKALVHEPRDGEDRYITPSDDASMEWGYVIDPEKRTITVLKRYWKDGTPYVGFGWMSAEKPVRWVAIEVIDLEGEEPDWEKLNNIGYARMG